MRPLRGQGVQTHGAQLNPDSEPLCSTVHARKHTRHEDSGSLKQRGPVVTSGERQFFESCPLAGAHVVAVDAVEVVLVVNLSADADHHLAHFMAQSLARARCLHLHLAILNAQEIFVVYLHGTLGSGMKHKSAVMPAICPGRFAGQCNARKYHGTPAKMQVFL